jgi:hypothetical protein
MELTVTIHESGPVLQGRGPEIVRRWQDTLLDDVAAAGTSMVKENLNAVLRHQTGHYVSQVHPARDGANRKVTDGGVIYGPWLEGTGSRNRTTRFKGYATFRRTVQALQARADQMADGRKAELVRELS